MKIEGTHTFTAAREIVWPMLQDPDVLANVMPGCEKLERVGQNQFNGNLIIRVGPVQGKFNGDITLSNINAPDGYDVEVNGKGSPGFVKGNGRIHLTTENDATLMQYEGDVQVGGRLASVGQRLLHSSANAIIRQSLEGLDKQIQAHLQPETADTPATTPSPPTQTQFAAGVAQNMLDEWLPPQQREDLLLKGAIALGVMLFVRLINEWWMNRLARKIARRIQKGGSD